MNAGCFKTLRAAHRAHPEPKTLLVDDDVAHALVGENGVALLAQAGLAPEEMWACQGVGAMTLVVLSAPRTAREMFRVLSLAERLVAPGGKILLMPVADSASEEIRPEATEIFCGVHPEWSRRQVEGNVVELWRPEKPGKPSKARHDAAVAEGRDPYSNITAAEKRIAALKAQAALLQADDGKLGEWLTTTMRESAADPSPGKHVMIGDPAVTSRVASEEDLRGKRVVSLSIFGDCRFSTDFWKQMPEFAVTYILAHHALFPGYELRIHHDEHLFHANGGDVLLGLERRGLVKLVHVPSRPGQGKCERMLHRLMPAWDPDVEYVICRDVDSLPTWRDRRAVEEFITSGLDAHTILDSCSHMGIMGGLCAFRAEVLRKMMRDVVKALRSPTGVLSAFDVFIASAGYSDEAWGVHGADQIWLNRITSVMSIFEHCLPKESDPRYPIIRGNQEAWRAGRDVTVVTEIADSDLVDVSAIVRGGSDALTGHMGSSGYPLEAARAFYDLHSPFAAMVREVEIFAGREGRRTP